MRWWSRHHLESELPELLGLIALAAALYLAAAAGMAYVAGFGQVRRALEHPVWWWLPVSAGAVAVSFGGYYFGYRGVGKVENGPDRLAPFRMDGAAEIVAFGTAMIVTRRTGPHGGAGILMTALPPTLWQSGAPRAPAVLDVFACRFFTLWLPMPFAFLALPALRALGEQADETPGGGTGAEEDEPALRH